LPAQWRLRLKQRLYRVDVVPRCVSRLDGRTVGLGAATSATSVWSRTAERHWCSRPRFVRLAFAPHGLSARHL